VTQQFAQYNVLSVEKRLASNYLHRNYRLGLCFPGSARLCPRGNSRGHERSGWTM